MEPDVERCIAPSPPPPIDHDKPPSRSSLSSHTVGRQDNDAISSHSAVTSTILENTIENKHEDNVQLEHTTSTADSIHPVAVKVLKAQRRGLFGRFTVLAEVEEPKDYAQGTKWFITFIVALAAVAAPLGSAIILPVSTNIAMLVITRLLGGGAAASVQTVGAGTIADIWDVKERGKAMGVFYLGPLMGPFLAPIIGGVLAHNLGWRSTQWALAVYGGFLLFILFFALPETLKNPVLVIEESAKGTEVRRPTLKKTTSAQVVHQKTKFVVKWLKRVFVDPLKIMHYLRFPAVAITVYYASITFGALYLLNISLEDTFSRPPYNFSTIQVGLTYIPNSVGYILASLFGGKWVDNIMAREARRANRYDEKGKLIYRPEDRMRENAWIAAFLYPGALLWYGWTVEKGVIWPVPVSPLSFPSRPWNITNGPNIGCASFAATVWHAPIYRRFR
ncbi:MAG: hypothetical protein L6R37_001180 [Teloschistes peruensis]|nr:MAG: hypothetical protein L6R37_001180 [Teloschistes peruensis]